MIKMFGRQPRRMGFFETIFDYFGRFMPRKKGVERFYTRATPFIPHNIIKPEIDEMVDPEGALRREEEREKRDSIERERRARRKKIRDRGMEIKWTNEGMCGYGELVPKSQEPQMCPGFLPAQTKYGWEQPKVPAPEPWRQPEPWQKPNFTR